MAPVPANYPPTPYPQPPAQPYAPSPYPAYTPYPQPAPVPIQPMQPVFVQPQIVAMPPVIITTQRAPEPPSSAWAIASFICSLLGISILGVIFGHVALSEINKSNGQMAGRGLAIAGLILGYIPLTIIAFFILIGVLSAASTPH